MTNDRNQIIEDIKNEALQTIEAVYANLSYHNMRHTKHVLKAAHELAQDIGLPQSEQELLTLAAAAHDVIQDVNPVEPDYHGENEIQSAEWIERRLHEYSHHFNDRDIETVKQAILATQIKHREDGLLQSAENGHLLSEILCDADLASLGSPWEVYLPQMVSYFHEVYPSAHIQNWQHYLRIQIPTLLQHHYYTAAAQERFHHLRRNAQQIEELLQNPDEIKKSFESMD